MIIQSHQQIILYLLISKSISNINPYELHLILKQTLFMKIWIFKKFKWFPFILFLSLIFLSFLFSLIEAKNKSTMGKALTTLLLITIYVAIWASSPIWVKLSYQNQDKYNKQGPLLLVEVLKLTCAMIIVFQKYFFFYNYDLFIPIICIERMEFKNAWISIKENSCCCLVYPSLNRIHI